MKIKVFFKIFILFLTIILIYFLYKQILILKFEYAKREEQKKIFLEKIDKAYIERNKEFYKLN